MIEHLWSLLGEFWQYLGDNFDPFRSSIDIVIVTFAIYWMLLLIRGTRAVQILLGLLVLIAASAAAEWFQLVTLDLILDGFIVWAPVILVVIFQHDIRRALARVGRGLFPAVSAQQESQIVEEVVRAAQVLAQKRVGALVVLERETNLDDQIEAGTPVDAAVTKELLTSIFLPYSPLHDGAVVIQNGRIAYAGCILPLTVKRDLPEGVGTRHRAALGITEETDAVVVVVSEETAGISVMMGGEMIAEVDAPRLRVVLREILTGDRRDLSEALEGGSAEPEEAPTRTGRRAASSAADAAGARSAG